MKSNYGLLPKGTKSKVTQKIHKMTQGKGTPKDPGN